MISTSVGPIVHTGILLPESVLQAELFGVLAAFVAINTVIYACMALANVLPKVYPTDWVTDRNRRTETRSIYPHLQGLASPGGRPAPATDRPRHLP